MHNAITSGLSVLALALIAAASVAHATAPLFDTSALKKSAASATHDDAGVTRKQSATLHVDTLRRVQDAVAQKRAGAEPVQLALPFFEDAALIVTIEKSLSFEHHGRTVRALHGVVPGVPFSAFTMIEMDGIVAANVRALSQQFQIRYRDDTGHEVREVDARAFVDHDDKTYPRFVEKQRFAASEPRKAAPSSAGTSPTKAEDGSQIDVMVIYTPQARVVSRASTAALHWPLPKPMTAMSAARSPSACGSFTAGLWPTTTPTTYPTT